MGFSGIVSLIDVCSTSLHTHIHVVSVLLIAWWGMNDVAIVDGKPLNVVVYDAWIALYVHHA